MRNSGKEAPLEAVRVPIQVVIGETELPLARLAAVGEGTILALDSLAGEPVRVLASGEQIAWGEVVVINENFGVRITGLLGRERGEG